jgi:hypothetical protein
MSGASIFMSHNHRDKTFVRALAQDLRALGVTVWLDEAEIRVGDSLIEKISTGIDAMRFLGVVLSPNSVDSRWVKEELNQALVNQLSSHGGTVLPIMLVDCEVPGFLRGRAYADFRDPGLYEKSLTALLDAMQVSRSKVTGPTISDPFAREFGRVEFQYARPRVWHCIYCGWRCDDQNNSYLCLNCKAVRTFAGGSATMKICRRCGQCSLAVATFCEWCGIDLRVSLGATRTYRCPWDHARVTRCLSSEGDRISEGQAIVHLLLPTGQELSYPFPSDSSHFEYLVEEVLVVENQLLFEGDPLAIVRRID